MAKNAQPKVFYSYRWGQVRWPCSQGVKTPTINKRWTHSYSGLNVFALKNNTLKTNDVWSTFECKVTVSFQKSSGDDGKIKRSNQFNSVYIKITNSPQRASQSVHIRHPWPLTSHWIRKNNHEIQKTLSHGK